MTQGEELLKALEGMAKEYIKKKKASPWYDSPGYENLSGKARGVRKAHKLVKRYLPRIVAEGGGEKG